MIVKCKLIEFKTYTHARAIAMFTMSMILRSNNTDLAAEFIKDDIASILTRDCKLAYQNTKPTPIPERKEFYAIYNGCFMFLPVVNTPSQMEFVKLYLISNYPNITKNAEQFNFVWFNARKKQIKFEMASSPGHIVTVNK